MCTDSRDQHRIRLETPTESDVLPSFTVASESVCVYTASVVWQQTWADGYVATKKTAQKLRRMKCTNWFATASDWMILTSAHSRLMESWGKWLWSLRLLKTLRYSTHTKHSTLYTHTRRTLASTYQSSRYWHKYTSSSSSSSSSSRITETDGLGGGTCVLYARDFWFKTSPETN